MPVIIIARSADAQTLNDMPRSAMLSPGRRKYSKSKRWPRVIPRRRPVKGGSTRPPPPFPPCRRPQQTHRPSGSAHCPRAPMRIGPRKKHLSRRAGTTNARAPADNRAERRAHFQTMFQRSIIRHFGHQTLIRQANDRLPPPARPTTPAPDPDDDDLHNRKATCLVRVKAPDTRSAIITAPRRYQHRRRDRHLKPNGPVPDRALKGKSSSIARCPIQDRHRSLLVR